MNHDKINKRHGYQGYYLSSYNYISSSSNKMRQMSLLHFDGDSIAMNSNIPRVLDYHVDTPSLAKSDAKVKAIWPSH